MLKFLLSHLPELHWCLPIFKSESQAFQQLSESLLILPPAHAFLHCISSFFLPCSSFLPRGPDCRPPYGSLPQEFSYSLPTVPWDACFSSSKSVGDSLTLYPFYFSICTHFSLFWFCSPVSVLISNAFLPSCTASYSSDSMKHAGFTCLESQELLPERCRQRRLGTIRISGM